VNLVRQVWPWKYRKNETAGMYPTHAGRSYSPRDQHIAYLYFFNSILPIAGCASN
jgi:hypothetical protein